jgi:hypothetical protein
MFFTRLSLGQGLYYVLSGLWPLFSIRTFLKITGPKADLWLVKTAGVLIALMGAVLALAGLRRQAPPEVVLLGAGSAAALATVDIVYVTRRRISAVYLLDAVVELMFLAGWALGGRPSRGWPKSC